MLTKTHKWEYYILPDGGKFKKCSICGKGKRIETKEERLRRIKKVGTK